MGILYTYKQAERDACIFQIYGPPAYDYPNGSRLLGDTDTFQDWAVKNSILPRQVNSVHLLSASTRSYQYFMPFFLLLRRGDNRK